MGSVFRAIELFWGHLSAIAWGPLALAVVCHLLKVVARTRSWRNILAASYPDAEVRWRSVFGSYAAGVGVNAVIPARGGDLLKLYLIKHRVQGATYPTLGATLLVETLFDIVIASALLVWVLSLGVLPGLDVIPSLPGVDWFWLFQNPRVAAAVAFAMTVVGFALGVWTSGHVAAFWERVRQGFAILESPGRYVREVLTWQTVDWTFRLATIYFFLVAFGLPSDLNSALLVQVTHSLSTILPLTPGGIGTEQALIVWVFAGTASASAVLSFSVGMKLVLVAANLALGFAAIGFMLRTFRWRRHMEGDREAILASRGRGGSPAAGDPGPPGV